MPIPLHTLLPSHAMLKCAVIHPGGKLQPHARRTCPRRTISDLRSFFIAQIFPVVRSRHIRTCAWRV